MVIVDLQVKYVILERHGLMYLILYLNIFHEQVNRLWKLKIIVMCNSIIKKRFFLKSKRNGSFDF